MKAIGHVSEGEISAAKNLAGVTLHSYASDYYSIPVYDGREVEARIKELEDALRKCSDVLETHRKTYPRTVDRDMLDALISAEAAQRKAGAECEAMTTTITTPNDETRQRRRAV